MQRSNWVKPLTYTLIILIGPLLAYYLLYVESRSEILLNRSFSHLANITQLTEARFDSVGDVLRNACDFLKGDDVAEANQYLEKSDFGLQFIAPSGIDRASIPCDANMISTIRSSRNSVHIYLNDESGNSNPGSGSYIDVSTSDIVGDIDLSGLFYDILIFGEYGDSGSGTPNEGLVIYQKSPEQGRIASARNLVEGSWFRGADAAANVADIVRDPLEEMRINYRGESFLMLSQPLQVDFGGMATDAQNWSMVGLIEEGNFNSEKLQFQPSTVALFTLIIAAIALSAPFLKIWYMGRFEPFKKVDLILLFVSGFVLCSLLTLVFVDHFVRTSTQAFMDERLDFISKKIKSDLTNELELVLDELSLAERAMRRTYHASRESVSTLTGSPPWSTDCPYLAGDQLEQVEGETVDFIPTFGGDLLAGFPGFEDYLPTTYPFFNQLYLMDRNGCQLTKYGTRSSPTSASQFEDRAYFRGSLINPRVPQQSYVLKDNDTEPFFLEFITSRTTGEKSVAISIPVASTDPDRDLSVSGSPQADCLNPEQKVPMPCVAVMTTSTLRALQPVLPFGFGFALTNSNGELLVHHEGRTNTEINLSEEIGDGSLLTSALIGNSPEPFSSDYHGQVHRFQALPLEIQGADMFLVTFYSEDIAHTPLLESAGVSVVIWLSLFALLLFTVFLILQLSKRGKLRFKMVSTLMCYVRRHPTADILLFLGLAVALSVIPVCWFFTTNYNEAVTGFYQLQLVNEGREIRQQETAIRQWAVDRATQNDSQTLAYLDDEDREQRADFRGTALSETWKQYPLFTGPESGEYSCRYEPNAASTTAQSLSLGQRFARYLLGRIPDYSSDTTQLHAMYRNIKLFAGDQICDTGMIRASFVPDATPSRYAVYCVLLFAIILVVVALRYVFLRVLGVENYFREYEFLPPGRHSGGRHIVFGGNDSNRRALFADVDAARIEWIDLRARPEQDSLEDNTQRDESVDIVVLDYFDDGLVDEATLLTRVSFLEKLARDSELSIVLMTSIDLLTYVTASYQGSEHTELITRLASVLSQFSLSYCPAGKLEAVDNSPANLVLLEECDLPELHSVYKSIQYHAKHSNLEREQIIELVKTHANAVYQHLWNLSTRSEKVMLVELAKENLVNPNNWDVALRLHRRGLLKRDPLHRIFNESFKQFILRMDRIENVSSWRKDKDSSWKNIRAPLFVLVIGAIVFLASTQPSFVNSVVAFAAAGAASMPFLINLIMQRLTKTTGK